MPFSRATHTRRVAVAGVLLALALASPARADPESNPADCTGVGFDARAPLVVSRVVPGAAKNFFVKSAWEDAAGPSQAPACRAKAYLVPGDLVLTGAARGPLTCVAYQSPRDRKQNWTNGWFPSARLQAVAPARAPRVADWTGTWTHVGGEIELRVGEGGKLAIEGLHGFFG